MSVFNGYLMSLTEHTAIKNFCLLFWMVGFDLFEVRLLMCDLEANIWLSSKLSYSFCGMDLFDGKNSEIIVSLKICLSAV